MLPAARASAERSPRPGDEVRGKRGWRYDGMCSSAGTLPSALPSPQLWPPGAESRRRRASASIAPVTSASSEVGDRHGVDHFERNTSRPTTTTLPCSSNARCCAAEVGAVGQYCCTPPAGERSLQRLPGRSGLHGRLWQPEHPARSLHDGIALHLRRHDVIRWEADPELRAARPEHRKRGGSNLRLHPT